MGRHTITNWFSGCKTKFKRDDESVNNNTDAGSEDESLLPDNLGVTESSAIKSCLEDSKTPMDLHS